MIVPISMCGMPLSAEHVAIAIGDAECVRAWSHTGVGLHKVIVRGARHGDPLPISVEIFELCDRVAVVANLHRRPPLVAAIFKVIADLPPKGDF